MQRKPRGHDINERGLYSVPIHESVSKEEEVKVLE